MLLQNAPARSRVGLLAPGLVRCRGAWLEAGDRTSASLLEWSLFHESTARAARAYASDRRSESACFLPLPSLACFQSADRISPQLFRVGKVCGRARVRSRGGDDPR